MKKSRKKELLEKVIDRLYSKIELETRGLWQKSTMVGIFLSLCLLGYGVCFFQIVLQVKDATSVDEFYRALESKIALNITSVVISFFSVIVSMIWIRMSKASVQQVEQYQQEIDKYEQKIYNKLPVEDSSPQEQTSPTSTLLDSHSPLKFNLTIAQGSFLFWEIIFAIHFCFVSLSDLSQKNIYTYLQIVIIVFAITIAFDMLLNPKKKQKSTIPTKNLLQKTDLLTLHPQYEPFIGQDYWQSPLKVLFLGYGVSSSKNIGLDWYNRFTASYDFSAQEIENITTTNLIQNSFTKEKLLPNLLLQVLKKYIPIDPEPEQGKMLDYIAYSHYIIRPIDHRGIFKKDKKVAYKNLLNLNKKYHPDLIIFTDRESYKYFSKRRTNRDSIAYTDFLEYNQYDKFENILQYFLSVKGKTYQG